MVYNRCIGTRFCSNNCPYKVRRFNYFDFAARGHRPPHARNPEVTVRGRGVMEKCTFCLQRIAEARIVADIENRPIGADEVPPPARPLAPRRPSASATWPKAARWWSASAARSTYALLHDQDTRPRVTYEARISNRNPALERGVSGVPFPRVRSGGAARQQQPRHDRPRLRLGDAKPGVSAGGGSRSLPAPLLTCVLLVSIVWLFWQGVGIWGIDWPVMWGFAIINYVWWIAIASGGTFISALFYLTRSEWRSSINRSPNR